jgi:hypothetical protein
MHSVLPSSIFNKERIECPACHWKGSGSEIIQEELFLTDAIEVFCPSCEQYLGFVSLEEKSETETERER